MIDPAAIPRIEGDMAELTAHADSIGTCGSALADTGERVHQTWQSLAAVYLAPEAGQLLAATGPVKSIAASVGEDLGTVAAALRVYATDTAEIQTQLEALRGEAALVAAYGAAQDESSTITLDERGGELSAAVAAQIAAWETAQLRCANAIRALTGAPLYNSAATLVEYGSGTTTVYPEPPTGPVREIFPIDETPPVNTGHPVVGLGPLILINVPAPPTGGVIDGPGSVPPDIGLGGAIYDRNTPDPPPGGAGRVDVGGFWERANGDKPDPRTITVGGNRAHILYGDGDDTGGGHRFDSGVPDKTVFPEDWDDNRIIETIEDVARNPDSPPEFDEERGTWRASGVRDGVAIDAIVKPDGTIVTGHPTGGGGVHLNDANGDPQPLN